MARTITITQTGGTRTITVYPGIGAAGAAGEPPTNANVGAVLAAATSKTTPVDADTIPLTDSAASNALKKLTWANLKATLASYFSGIYAALVHSHVSADVTDAKSGGGASDNGKIVEYGVAGRIYTSGAEAYIYTQGAEAPIYTEGVNSPIFTTGGEATIYTTGSSAEIYTNGSSASISTKGAEAYIQTRSTFRLSNGTYTTTLSHNPTANRAIAFPNSAGTLALTSDITGTNSGTNTGDKNPVVKDANFTAEIDEIYHVTANLTVTDPVSPTEGKGFAVFVRNGTATIGGTAYSTAGTTVRRVYHSGSYSNYATTHDAGVATLTNKSINAGQLTGNIDVARIATALTTPGAIGGTTASTGAFTTLSASGVTTISAGSAGTPSISFSGDPDTGIYSDFANQFKISTAGVVRFSAFTGGVESAGQVRALGTTAATPGFVGSNDTNTGVYMAGSDVMGFATNGLARWTINASGELAADATSGGGLTLTKTITAVATTGAQTINKSSGRVNFAAAATSLVVTNSLCTANSIIHISIATNDTTATGMRVVAAAGSFTIHMLNAPTSETAVNFLLTN